MKKYVYVLELEKKKHYVGLCVKGDPYKRIRDHYKSNGARFTQRNKVVKLVHLEEVKDPLEELIITLTYMHEHCINNVRGDKFVQDKISEKENYEICKLIQHLRNDEFHVLLCQDGIIRISEDLNSRLSNSCLVRATFPADSQKITTTLRCIENFGFSQVESDIYNSKDHEMVCVTLRHANQRCIKCGDRSHFAKSCPFTEFQPDDAMFHKKKLNPQIFVRFCQEICEDIQIRERRKSMFSIFY